MIRPHTPPQTPAEKPAHSGEGGGAWRSPWDLDHEWRDAPAAKKKRFIEEDKPASTPPPREPPAMDKPMVPAPPAEIEAQVTPLPNVAPPSRLVTMPRRPRVPVEREASWSTLVILSMGLLAFVFIVWQYLDDPALGADEDLLLKRPVDQAQCPGVIAQVTIDRASGGHPDLQALRGHGVDLGLARHLGADAQHLAVPVDQPDAP